MHTISLTVLVSMTRKATNLKRADSEPLAPPQVVQIISFSGRTIISGEEDELPPRRLRVYLSVNNEPRK
jgi:hypothetical protein